MKKLCIKIDMRSLLLSVFRNVTGILSLHSISRRGKLRRMNKTLNSTCKYVSLRQYRACVVDSLGLGITCVL